MLNVIVLAGGRARRAGHTHKACRRVGNRHWLALQLHTLRSTLRRNGGGSLTLVTGYRSRQVLRCAGTGISAAINRGIGRTGQPRIRFNPWRRLGPFASLQCGLGPAHTAHVPDTWLVLPLDVPAPTAAELYRLRHALHAARCEPAANAEASSTPATAAAMACVPVDRDGRGGHPVLLNTALAARLRRLDPRHADARLDMQLHRLDPSCYRRVPLRHHIAERNLNTARQWQAYLRRR